MREFEERRRVKKLLHSRYAIAVLVIVAVLLVRGVWGAYQKFEKSEAFADKMRAEHSTLKDKEASLVASLAELDTEDGREREIRDRFGAIREGEKLIILVDDASATRNIPLTSEKSFWKRLWSFFTRD